MKGNICKVCTGHDIDHQWERFRKDVETLGGEVLEPEWLGVDTPHRARCALGHNCKPRPYSVRGGGGLCGTCARNDTEDAGRRFHALVKERGGEVLEPWQGAYTRILVRCALSHEHRPLPSSVLGGGGMCKTCSKSDPADSERRFRCRVLELGGELLEPEWLGAATPHRVRCSVGHAATPRPAEVHQGGGICRSCAGYEWDVFYVVCDTIKNRVKFGITSGNGNYRLKVHRGKGYTEIVRQITGLVGNDARTLENLLIRTMKDAGIKPIAGHLEHYDIAALALVLDIVDNYPFTDQGGTPAPVEPAAAPAEPVDPADPFADLVATFTART